MTLTYGMISRTGNRAENEDSAICIEQEGAYCFVVADGLGGHGGGALASRKLTELFKREFYRDSSDSTSFLIRAFELSQNEILAMQSSNIKMRTTAVALVMAEGKAFWGHIGDSRLYHFRKKRLQNRTLDHSVPQMLVYSRQIKASDIPHHPDRNKLLRVIGDNREKPQYELAKPVKLKRNEAFLLCSDGLWEYLTDSDMETALQSSDNAGVWLDTMLSEAERKGRGEEMDNYTAITVML